MKYVMFKSNDQLIPVIFPNQLVHSKIADALIHNMVIKGEVEIVSAGTVNGLSVYSVGDKSDTLKIGSIPTDREVINTYDYTLGMLDFINAQPASEEPSSSRKG